MKYHTAHNSESGFFKLIAIIIIAAAILTFLGYNPLTLWDSYAVPAILWVWDVLYTIIVFIINVVTAAVNAARGAQ